ncbi:MAG: ABC transporter permease [Saprospiraceae bacterium]|nr:ABC transporter permease [Saprospiraceae bacterium]
MSTLSRNIQAETYKLKRTPILWLSLIGGTMVAGVVFLVFYLNGANPPEAGVNPWKSFFNMSYTIASTLVLVPFIILVTSSLTQFEHSNSAWKQLYSFPISRGSVFFSKGITVFGLIALTYVVFMISIFPVAYLLSIYTPDYGFQDYAPVFGPLFKLFFHSFISILGVTAFQYWLCYRWKTFMAPIGIGMLGFIIGPLLLSKPKIAIFLPHCHPIWYVKGLDHAITRFGLTTPEVYSLVFFVLFVALGYFQETRRNID